MPTTLDETNVYTQLRNKAEALLKAGTSPTTTSHCSMGIDALRLLHRLSSNPENAEDALKLLHELQVHQVELDLQNEEIAASEQALVEDRGLYRALYDCAPVGYCVVDHLGTVIQSNLAATELFGVSQDDLEGQQIGTFLNPQTRPRLLALLQRVTESNARDCCVAETGGCAQGSRHLQFLASIPPGHAHILLVCCECGSVE